MNNRGEVLVVDDDADFRAVVAEVLKSERCDIREASNGQVALRMARERTPNLILTDLAMPSMNGWELYDALAHDEHLSRVPVVIDVGRGVDPAARRGLRTRQAARRGRARRGAGDDAPRLRPLSKLPRCGGSVLRLHAGRFREESCATRQGGGNAPVRSKRATPA